MVLQVIMRDTCPIVKGAQAVPVVFQFDRLHIADLRGVGADRGLQFLFFLTSPATTSFNCENSARTSSRSDWREFCSQGLRWLRWARRAV